MLARVEAAKKVMEVGKYSRRAKKVLLVEGVVAVSMEVDAAVNESKSRKLKKNTSLFKR